MFKFVMFLILSLVFTFSLVSKNEKVESKGYIIMPPVVADGDVTPIPSSTIREDYRDLIVANAEGQQRLSIWRENTVSGEGILNLWFKTYLRTNTDTNWYLYYDNPTYTTDLSNPFTMFMFYDDFSGNLSGKWSILATQYLPTIQNGMLRIEPRAGGYSLYDGDIMRTHASYWVRYTAIEYMLLDIGVEWIAVGWRHSDMLIHHLYGFYYGKSNAVNELRLRTGWAETKLPNTYQFATGIWYNMRVIENYPHFYFDVNDVRRLSLTSTDSDITLSRITINGANRWDDTTYVLIDNVRVRRYVFPEPTLKLGVEESGNWNGFKKRRQITIKNNTNLSMPDYQFKLPIQIKTLRTYIGDM